jgi:hypothetical protein
MSLLSNANDIFVAAVTHGDVGGIFHLGSHQKHLHRVLLPHQMCHSEIIQQA